MFHTVGIKRFFGLAKKQKSVCVCVCVCVCV